MRTYGEYCAVAKALDVVGDRWTLLIVRELLLRGDCRYTDLRNGLPGIATNLLAERLRELEQAGLSRSRGGAAADRDHAVQAHAPRAGARNRAARAWPFCRHMETGPAPGDEFRGHWLSWPVELFISDDEPDGPPVRIALRVGDEDLILQSTTRASICILAGSTPDMTWSGPARDPRGSSVAGCRSVQRVSGGCMSSGDLGALRRLQPQA